jgi:nicotinamide riboside transporter PnuC
MWSWVLEGIGIVGATFVGRKHWWAWIILLVNAVLWTIYGFTSKQYGFCFASIFYAFVYGRNCYAWFTKRKVEE